MKNLIALLSILIIIGSSCHKTRVNECMIRSIRSIDLVGNWTHAYKSSESDSTVQPDYFQFIEFQYDSFKITVTHYNDKLDPDCEEEGDQTEYIKGTMYLAGNQIYFDGDYCNADFSIKTDGCYNIGAYADTFSVICLSNEVLKLYANSYAKSQKFFHSEEFRNITLVKQY